MIRFCLPGACWPLVAALSLGYGGTQRATASADGLFAASPASETLQALPRNALRQRVVVPDFRALLAAAANRPGKLSLDLFPDATFTGLVDRVTYERPGTISYYGRLQEDDLGDFSLVQNHGAVVGTVRSPRRGAVYSITFTPEQVHVVRQLSEAAFGACGNKPGAPASGVANPSDDPPTEDASCGDDGALAVLVVYTGVTRGAAGGTAAMEAEVRLAVATSNTVYSNSAVGMRMRLVHTEEVAYNEAGTFQNHLDRLVSTNDGILDNVHTLRDRYGADTVVMIVEDDDSEQAQSLCGLAWGMNSLADSFKTQAFAIVNRGCASNNFSFPHEVGHNLGCDHDRANADPASLYSYAFGWQFNGNPSGSRWRSVMAYNGTPGSTRVGFFSNPNVSFDGTPTGVAIGQANEANNAQVIDNVALTATNWRRNTMWAQFRYGGTQIGCPSQPFDSFGGATNAVPWTGTVVVKAGTSSERITINKPMTITSSGGVAVIGKQ